MNFSLVPNQSVIAKTVEELKKHGISVSVVSTKEEAFKKIIDTLPEKTKVMNGSSTTLKEVGFVDYLKENPKHWINLHEEILKEKDAAKQADLRRRSVADADIFLASVNAITQNGELIACDATGSRVGAFPFAAKKLLLVAGAQKIVGSVEEGMKRIREYVLPLEDKRMHEAYGFGSATNKWVIIEKEQPGRIELILVTQSLGF
jgi:hypothetical protein